MLKGSLDWITSTKLFTGKKFRARNVYKILTSHCCSTNAVGATSTYTQSCTPISRSLVCCSAYKKKVGSENEPFTFPEKHCCGLGRGDRYGDGYLGVMGRRKETGQ